LELSEKFDNNIFTELNTKSILSDVHLITSFENTFKKSTEDFEKIYSFIKNNYNSHIEIFIKNFIKYGFKNVDFKFEKFIKFFNILLENYSNNIYFISTTISEYIFEKFDLFFIKYWIELNSNNINNSPNEIKYIYFIISYQLEKNKFNILINHLSESSISRDKRILTLISYAGRVDVRFSSSKPSEGVRIKNNNINNNIITKADMDFEINKFSKSLKDAYYQIDEIDEIFDNMRLFDNIEIFICEEIKMNTMFNILLKYYNNKNNIINTNNLLDFDDENNIKNNKNKKKIEKIIDLFKL
jgi:hypothetical protein